VSNRLRTLRGQYLRYPPYLCCSGKKSPPDVSSCPIFSPVPPSDEFLSIGQYDPGPARLGRWALLSLTSRRRRSVRVSRGPSFIESPSKSSRSAGGLVRESWRARTRQLQPGGCAGQQHESGGENHCSWWCEHLTTAVRLGLVHSDG
jgi:hypothetical protein